MKHTPWRSLHRIAEKITFKSPRRFRAKTYSSSQLASLEGMTEQSMSGYRHIEAVLPPVDLGAPFVVDVPGSIPADMDMDDSAASSLTASSGSPRQSDVQTRPSIGPGSGRSEADRLGLSGILDLSNTETVDKTQKFAQPVVHETVVRQIHEVREIRTRKEIHNHQYVQRILPVRDIEVLPARHFLRCGSNGTLKEIEPGRIAELDDQFPISSHQHSQELVMKELPG